MISELTELFKVLLAPLVLYMYYKLISEDNNKKK